jgi:hypothetical protein
MFDQWMDNVFQLPEGIRVIEDMAPKFGPVYLAITIHDPIPEDIYYLLVTRRTFGHSTVRENIRIYDIRTQVFKHFADNTFSRGNIAG